MSQPHGSVEGASSLMSLPVAHDRLRHYLPADLSDALAHMADRSEKAAAQRVLEVFVHLAATRYTIATYLPRLLVRQALDERLASPWVHPIEGTLLFADLSGSTALAERLGALGREGTELVTDFLNDIFGRMIQIVHTYGGDLVSFGGDALLVFFNDAAHPHTALNAAQALQEALHGYVRSLEGIGTFPMHLHVGIESGPVTFASAGPAHALHYGLLGAAVNRVARAEAHAGPGETVAGPAAWAALHTSASATELAPGYYRIDSSSRQAHAPVPRTDATAPVDVAPHQAIPRLLADLDRISAYMPPSLLGRIVADPQRPRLEADLRPVSVLFAQVTGLDTPVEALPPEAGAQVIQAYLEPMQAAIEACGGVVNKLDVADEGMKLLAIFGAPAAYEDHAERAARAAIEMQHRLHMVHRRIEALCQEYDPQHQRRAGRELRQRIGLNTGNVFAGNVGSADRKEYTVMGDAVNVAARVMAQAGWGEVWCSAAVRAAIDTRMICEACGEVPLKGKAAPLELFCLRGERDEPAVAPTSGGIPLIGRAAELAMLRDQLEAALAGSGRALRVVGEAGVGKSRLLGELAGLARERGVRVLAAACLSYTTSMPYAAWGEWLKACCNIGSGDSDAERRHKLEAQLAHLGPGFEEWSPLLGDLLRLDIADNALTRGLDPQMRQARRFELIERLLLQAATSAPLLVLFEDLHWADPISLDLWRRVTTTIAGQPILLLGAHRPSPALAPGSDAAAVIELRELSATESQQMAAALAMGHTLPEGLLHQVVARAGGNPLFLSELLRAVTEQHRSLEELPDSLNGLLLARIDRLDEGSRTVLRVASVIGQRIHFGVLQSIHAADQRALLLQLVRLDAEEMTILERLEPERVHAFRHALIQEVAYQSMLYARRRELHGRIGAYLERRYQHDLDDYYGLLAHHYRLSDQRDKAIHYLLKAGHAARDVYANEEAIQYYRWALEALNGDARDPRAWEAHDALGDVYATIGRYDEALQQHASILAAPGVTPEAARRAHGKRGSVLEKQGQYVPALDELERAMAIARSGAAGISPLAIPQISADIGLVRQRRGEYEQAIAACEQGLAAIRRDGRGRDDDAIEARLHSTLGGIYGRRGDYPRSRYHFEHSLRLQEAIDDLPGMIASNNNLGYLWQLQNEYARALEHYRVAEELARRITYRYGLIFAATNAAAALISLGRYRDAEERCTAALALAREMNAQHTIAETYNTLGTIYYHTGAYEQAASAYQQALHIHRSLGSAPQEANTLMHLALTLNAQGRYAEARATAETALARAEELAAQRLQAEARNALAEAAIGLGDLTGAVEHASVAATLSAALGSSYDQGIALRLRGAARAALGEPFSGDLEASVALLEAIDDRFELGRTWAAFGAALIQHGDHAGADLYLKQAHDAFIAVGADGELRRLSPILERSV